ncbi:MAG TPA: hypothetical protein VNC84_07260 [Gammaproteobacteria bacterium]|jgi:hypothetical protein|nr:hypothetical protein [Gammaproteobacteria bacterium]
MMRNHAVRFFKLASAVSAVVAYDDLKQKMHQEAYLRTQTEAWSYLEAAKTPFEKFQVLEDMLKMEEYVDPVLDARFMASSSDYTKQTRVQALKDMKDDLKEKLHLEAEAARAAYRR